MRLSAADLERGKPQNPLREMLSQQQQLTVIYKTTTERRVVTMYTMKPGEVHIEYEETTPLDSGLGTYNRALGMKHLFVSVGFIILD